MNPGTSGYVCVRNARIFDYGVVEAVKSLLPVCDEVVVCDGESEDDTREMVESIGDSRIRLITYPWQNPVADDRFWVKWLNYARERLAFNYQITLDADEVLAETSYDKVRSLAESGECGIFTRHNFWNDAKHLAPFNTVCGDTVARCGPSSLYCPSDEPYPAVEPNIRTHAELHNELEIFHYGFIRKPDAFVRKSKAVQVMFMGSCDRRITDMEESGKPWTERDYFEGKPLRDFSGVHPAIAVPWLRERGYDV